MKSLLLFFNFYLFNFRVASVPVHLVFICFTFALKNNKNSFSLLDVSVVLTSLTHAHASNLSLTQSGCPSLAGSLPSPTVQILLLPGRLPAICPAPPWVTAFLSIIHHSQIASFYSPSQQAGSAVDICLTHPTFPWHAEDWHFYKAPFANFNNLFAGFCVYPTI